MSISLILKKYIIILLAILCFQSSYAFAGSDLVIVNTKRHIYHKLSCGYTKRCKRSCVKISRVQAAKIYRARPCKICYKRKRSRK